MAEPVPSACPQCGEEHHLTYDTLECTGEDCIQDAACLTCDYAWTLHWTYSYFAERG